jgi:ketosteroid isomerase-like protein
MARTADENPNVAAVREMWSVYHARGLLGILDFAAPDATWRPFSADGRVFASTAEYRSYLEDVGPRDDIVEASMFDLHADGDCVVVSGRLRLRGIDGIRDNEMHWVHRFREGKIIWTASYTDLSTALEAAGLRPSHRVQETDPWRDGPTWESRRR